MRLDDSTFDSLWYQAIPWDEVTAAALEVAERLREYGRKRALRYYHRKRRDPAVRAKTAAKQLDRYHAKRAAEGKVSRRTKDKKTTAVVRMEIVTSTESLGVLAKRHGISKQAVAWIRKQHAARAA